MEKGEKGVDNLSVTAVMTFSFRPSFSHLRLKVEQDNESIIFIDIVFALLVYPHLLLLHFLFILYRSVDRFRSNLIFKYFYRYEVVLLWKIYIQNDTVILGQFMDISVCGMLICIFESITS